MAMMSKTYLVRLAYVVAALAFVVLAPAPARADFFDDVRRTVQTDIPHFFQDDIPCTFGGQPTSGTKTSCKSSPPHQATPVTRENTPHDVPNANAPVTSSPPASPGSD